MAEALILLITTYAGLAFAWPVLVGLTARFAARRYGEEVGRDVRRVVGPSFALFMLAAPLLIRFPLGGLMLFGAWIAYTDGEARISRPDGDSKKD